MNIENLTNVEILYNSNLKNKILIQIPKTNFHILCSYIKKNNAWNIHIVELISTKRKQIASKVSKKTVSETVERVLKEGMNNSFKNKRNFKQISEEIKTKIQKIQQKNDLQ